MSKQTADKEKAALNSSLQTKEMFSPNGKLIKTETLTNFYILITFRYQILNIIINESVL